MCGSGPFRWYWSSKMLLRADNRYHSYQDRERHFGKSSRCKRSKMGSQSRYCYLQPRWINTQKLWLVSPTFRFSHNAIMQLLASEALLSENKNSNNTMLSQSVVNPLTSHSKSSTLLSELIWHVVLRRSLYFCSCTTGGNFFVGLKNFDANIAIISDFVLNEKKLVYWGDNRVHGTIFISSQRHR